MVFSLESYDMRESKFTTEIIRSLKHCGHYAYKIPDSPLSKGMNSGMAYSKPCDIVAGVFGDFVGIETKIMNKFRAFGLYDMQPSQIKNLTEMIETGNKAFVFLNVRISSPFPAKRVNRLIVFEWGALSERFKTGSIMKDEIEELNYTKKSGKFFDKRNKKVDGVFDLSLFHAQLVSTKDF